MGSTDFKIDRTGWRPGRWDDEPDKLQWIDEATGLDCLIVRARHGNLCGYVGVPEGHAWHGKEYGDCRNANDEHPDAHGGLTYSGKCSGNICHVPEEGRPDNVWWLGFDCLHCWDGTPDGVFGDGEYRDVGYVRRQCTNLASQAAAIA